MARLSPTPGGIATARGNQAATGSAGGDLSGTYPNPTVATVGGVAPVRTGTTAAGDLSGTYPNPAVVQVQGRPVSATAPGTNQGLVWTGTAWAPAAVANSFNGRTGAVVPTTGDYTAAQVGALATANNLSDVASAATARTNLGALAAASNLSDVASAATSRTNLGLHYGAATLTWPGASQTSNQITISHGVGGVPSAVFLLPVDNNFNIAIQLQFTPTSTQFTFSGVSILGGNPLVSHTTPVYWLALP